MIPKVQGSSYGIATDPSSEIDSVVRGNKKGEQAKEPIKHDEQQRTGPQPQPRNPAAGKFEAEARRLELESQLNTLEGVKITEILLGD